MKSWISVLSFVAFFIAAIPAPGQTDKVDFVKQIKPILESHCLSCHMGEDAESVDLSFGEEAMDYIETGDAESSHLYELLISDDEDELMPPPDENNPLSEAQIELIKNWIDQGADWPEDVSFTISQDSDQPQTTDESATDETGENATVPENDDKVNEVVFKAIGSLHPAAVHVPIGLLLAAGLFALLGIRGNFVMSDCAYYCLWLGVIGAIAACVTGWWSVTSSQGQVAELADLWDMDHKVFWHRTSALIATGFALILALFAASARAKDPDDGVFWKLGLIVLAAAIGYVGYQGGKLTHGPNHYKHLNQLMNQLAPGVFGQPVENADGEQPQQPQDESNGGDGENGEPDDAEQDTNGEEGSGKASGESQNVEIEIP